MASEPEDFANAEKAQHELREQMRRCRTMVQSGRQLFMLAQAAPKVTAANSN